MVKNYLLVSDSDVYDIGKAIEENLDIWWNNENGKLKKGDVVFIYVTTSRKILYRGKCGKGKVAHVINELPGKDFVWETGTKKDKLNRLLDNGNFIEIEDIKGIVPRCITNTLEFDTDLDELSKKSFKLNVRRMNELSESMVKHLNTLKWV